MKVMLGGNITSGIGLLIAQRIAALGHEPVHAEPIPLEEPEMKFVVGEADQLVTAVFTRCPNQEPYTIAEVKARRERSIVRNPCLPQRWKKRK